MALSSSRLNVTALIPEGRSGKSGVGTTGKAFIRVNHYEKLREVGFEIGVDTLGWDRVNETVVLFWTNRHAP